ATPEPIVSGSSFSPKAPLVWRKRMPALSVMSVKRTSGTVAPFKGGNPPWSPRSGVSPPCSPLEPQPRPSSTYRRNTAPRIADRKYGFIMIPLFMNDLRHAGSALVPSFPSRAWERGHAARLQLPERVNDDCLRRYVGGLVLRSGAIDLTGVRL